MTVSQLGLLRVRAASSLPELERLLQLSIKENFNLHLFFCTSNTGSHRLRSNYTEEGQNDFQSPERLKSLFSLTLNRGLLG